ncbi:MAG: glycosyltransferase family 4 protein [Gemmatimonadetes bacterium]|nr:glycosyltransferase family 4 protein [Gemmatimonadota bacterium]
MVLGLSLAGSWVITGQIRRFALANAILDMPNGRSSHAVPTPRGGGVAIVLLVLCGTLLASTMGVLNGDTAAAFIGGGGVVALIGWVDDRRGVHAGVRAVVHCLAAVWAVFLLGGLPFLSTGTGHVHLGSIGGLLAVLGIVWATNLYNFMDGIDGIAGGQALCAGAFGGALLLLSGSAGLAAVAFLVAAATAGFLAWNWAPAKIFMGDVGSGFLGFSFGTLAVASENDGGVPLLLWVLLLGVFVVDATVTLLRRTLAGQVPYAAHRDHAYQRAVRSGWSHARVSGWVVAFNLALGVLSVVAWLRPPLLVPLVAGGLLLLLIPYVIVERRQAMFQEGAEYKATTPRRAP